MYENNYKSSIGKYLIKEDRLPNNNKISKKEINNKI